MKFSSFLRIAAMLCLSALLLPFATACSDGAVQNSDAESLPKSESSEAVEEVDSIAVGGKTFEISGEINGNADKNGVFIFTPDYGKGSAEKSEGEFFDAIVIDNTVIAVYGKGTCAVIPTDGYLIRFCGVNADIKVGDEAKCELLDIDSTPKKYVRFGDKTIEVGHENEIRTEEDIGWLYDSRWYSATTTNNIYCTEIAVLDGKIVEINRSGDSVGDTRIPEGGYVIAVGQGGSNERKTRDLQVGDDAELFLGEKLYTSKRFGISGTNRTRPNDGMVIFTRELQNTTPIGNNLTEVIVNKNGTITAVYENCSGMNKIPEDGFIISATGSAATLILRNANIGDTVFTNGARVIYAVTTPESVFERLKKTVSALKTAYEGAVERVDFVDFQAVSSMLDEIEDEVTAVEACLNSKNGYNGSELASSIEALLLLVKETEASLIPQITVQDRTAWVTLGEHNYDKSLLLHYKTQEDVDHTVAYAKSVGLNTLIIDNLAAGFAVYDSKVPGIVKLPQLGSVDLLAAFQRACDEQGMRLIIMVNAFSSGVDGVAYPANHYMSIYKDKYLITNKGRHIGPDGVITLDPADSDVQAFNLAVLAEICESYDVYGVQADYMRYPLPWFYQEHNYEDFGFNESSKSGFIKKYGKDPATLKISDPLWEDWCKWKRDIISDYQKRFYQTAKSINPDLNVSFTCFADYRDRQIYTCQDVEKWAEDGYADAIYPMIYGETTEYQLGYVEKNLPIAEFTDLVIGVGTYVRATHESMKEQLIMSYGVCVEGVSVFTVRYISICGYDGLYRKAFSTPATPATAPDEELVPAAADMAVNRLKSIAFIAKDESVKTSLDALAEKISKLPATGISLAEYCDRLSALKDEFAASAGDTAEEKAATQVLDYIIGLQ